MIYGLYVRVGHRALTERKVPLEQLNRDAVRVAHNGLASGTGCCHPRFHYRFSTTLHDPREVIVQIVTVKTKMVRLSCILGLRDGGILSPLKAEE
nr:hypothetical protein [Arthrobacter sp. N199823]